MNKLRIKKTKEKKLIGIKLRYYIDFVILLCFCVIAFNINPSNNEKNNIAYSNKQTMTYIFHDYAGNEYIMNDKIHGAPSSRDFLFNNEVPDDLKSGEQEFVDSVSLEDLTGDMNNNTDSIKDNQVSINDVMSDLGVENENNKTKSNMLVISIGGNTNETSTGSDNNYVIKEEIQPDNTSSLIIERMDDNSATSNNDINNNPKNNDTEKQELLTAKAFTFTKEGWILPVLVSRNELSSNNNTIAYINSQPNWSNNSIISDESQITIIGDYADCMTPWGYKIRHGDSILAYQQMSNAPDICNIERRFCWKGKLSGTYTQQGCSVNNNYTYEQRGEAEVSEDTNEFKGSTRQNSDGSVTVKSNEIGGSFVFDRPNNTYSDFNDSNNIRAEEPGIEQTKRSYPDCTSPRGEKVKHGQFIQTFKHANGFSDSPCEAQIRLCSVGELMGTYKESSCKTRDTSFIDRINGSTSRKTYSKEKIERVQRQIKNEEIYYENSRKNGVRSTNSDVLDRILYILDEDN